MWTIRKSFFYRHFSELIKGVRAGAVFPDSFVAWLQAKGVVRVRILSVGE